MYFPNPSVTDRMSDTSSIFKRRTDYLNSGFYLNKGLYLGYILCFFLTYLHAVRCPTLISSPRSSQILSFALSVTLIREVVLHLLKLWFKNGTTHLIIRSSRMVNIHSFTVRTNGFIPIPSTKKSNVAVLVTNPQSFILVLINMDE